MKPQFITDEKGNKVSVIIPIQDYNKLLNNLEELEDIKAYDKAKASGEESIPAEQAFREIEDKRDDLQS